MLRCWLPCFLGLLAPLICTMASWPFREWLGASSILLLYLLGVFLIASSYGRLPSVIASLVSAPAFAFFYAPPIFSFAISDLKNITGLGIMLIVANVTSNLVEALRDQIEVSEQRERWASILYRFTNTLSEAGTPKELAESAVKEIWQAFHGHSFLGLFQGTDQKEIEWIYSRKDRERATDPCLSQPCTNHFFELSGGAGTMGILMLDDDFNLPNVSSEEGKALYSFIQQISQSLERLDLVDKARKASLQAESETLRNCLLSAISHDLRTPLTRILGAASTLATMDASLSDKERHDFASAIQDEARHMADLTTRILDMARLSSGIIVPNREWNAIEEIVEGAIARLKIPLQGRDVDVDIPVEIPMIEVDAVLLQQVLINLLENAAQYTPPSSPILIYARLEEEGIRLHVVDRGPGVSPEQRDQLFKKFYRLNPDHPMTGVGLGLALCRSIMEAHGASISLNESKHGGCDFVLWFPLAKQQKWTKIQAESIY